MATAQIDGDGMGTPLYENKDGNLCWFDEGDNIVLYQLGEGQKGMIPKKDFNDAFIKEIEGLGFKSVEIE